MKLHLVGGFLGSGKTTAIASAAQLLMAQGQSVGVIMNDQGRYLVDSAYFEAQETPVAAVTGGCFCSNYDKLTHQLDELVETIQPDIIFAEAVGSCTDVVATVINPLLKLSQNGIKPTSFSVFTDSRLLYQRLSGGEMPFSEDVVYIFDKQIEEARLLIVNKRDLLTAGQSQMLLDMVKARYPEKLIQFQNSLEDSSVLSWLSLIDSENVILPRQAPDIDYTRYARGESGLAWLNEEITVRNIQQREARRAVIQFVQNILESLHGHSGNCHIKFLITGRQKAHKLSFVSAADDTWQNQIPDFDDEQLRILINARLETDIAELTASIDLALTGLVNRFGVIYQKERYEGFYPARPTPRHRIPE